MNIVQDKFLTEVMGDYWNTYGRKVNGYSRRCTECGKQLIPDFSTWDGFGKLWAWAQKQEWWLNFCETHGAQFNGGCFGHVRAFPTKFIEPEAFAKAVYEYLKENK